MHNKFDLIWLIWSLVSEYRFNVIESSGNLRIYIRYKRVSARWSHAFPRLPTSFFVLFEVPLIYFNCWLVFIPKFSLDFISRNMLPDYKAEVTISTRTMFGLLEDETYLLNFPCCRCSSVTATFSSIPPGNSITWISLSYNCIPDFCDIWKCMI